MLWYSQKTSHRIWRSFALFVNGMFPFLWPARHLFPVNLFRGVFVFWRDYFRYMRTNKDPNFPLKLLDIYPGMYDRWEQSGLKMRHYFHQDWWAAKKVFESKVKEHYDLGSRIDGFVAHTAVFCKIHVFDIRPLQPLNENVSFIQCDFTDMRNIEDGSIHSLSSLHVFEHIGLGRYGDQLDSQGLYKAVSEVKRILAKGGNFYFSVPIGIQRLEFNAQRVFYPTTVIEMFSGFDLVEFSVVTDQDDLKINADIRGYDGAEYSCGLFHFRKMDRSVNGS